MLSGERQLGRLLKVYKIQRSTLRTLVQYDTILHLTSTRETLVDRTPRDGGEVIPPIPYISESLVVDVCKINSTVFPNLGSMTHSKVSGWLCQ